MSDKAKTMQVPVMLKSAIDTGLITQEALDALEFEKLRAQEEIENLRTLYHDKIISHEQLEAGIRGVRQRIQDKIIALDFENT